MKTMTPEEIRKLRESRVWTTTELAYHVGVSGDAVRKWERGERVPRGPAMKKLIEIASRPNGHRGHGKNLP